MDGAAAIRATLPTLPDTPGVYRMIGADGRIVNIHANAVPHSLDAVNSAGPVKGILEINGGMSARLGIRPGDRVVHSAFGTAK